jgi:peptidase C39-like protein
MGGGHGIGGGGHIGIGHGHGGSGEHTPPGLANKPGEMPPGQFKHMHDGFDGHDTGGQDAQGAQGDQGNGQVGAQGAQGWGGGLLGFLGGLLNLGGHTQTQQVDGPKVKGNQPPPPPVDINGAQNGKAKDLPYISQYNPAGKDANYTNGAENCGPAVLAMIAKSRGQTGGLTDAQLVSKMQADAGTTADGTTGNGMIKGLQDLGMQTAANPGADLNWVNGQLAQGHEVMANGDFYSVPGRENPTLQAGHYIAVTGVQNGVYSVVDPADQNVKQMTAAQLQDFIASHPDGGFTLAAW